MRTVCCIALLLCGGNIRAEEATLQSSLRALNEVRDSGGGHQAAMAAWKIVAKSPTDSLPAILKAIDDKKPLGANWIRAAVDQIAERATLNGRELPTKPLEAIVFDTSYSPRARRLAYEWLVRVDEAAKARIIPNMLNDSSIEMRRDAVAMVLNRAEGADKQDAIGQYRIALSAARDTDQIDAAYEKLKSLGETVDLPTHFGFITQWKLMGPFDNTNQGGFEVAYAPEKDLDFDAFHIGKTGRLEWIDHQTANSYGMVNLNEALGKHMGAAAYAAAEFQSSKSQTVDLRLGCINASKVWLNGELLMSNEVYHSGTKIDQYVAQGQLKKGKNLILLKVCQNEQTEAWAQDWQFQFRICDSVGTAILADER